MGSAARCEPGADRPVGGNVFAELLHDLVFSESQGENTVLAVVRQPVVETDRLVFLHGGWDPVDRPLIDPSEVDEVFGQAGPEAEVLRLALHQPGIVGRAQRAGFSGDFVVQRRRDRDALVFDL
jgi:hypothetical protein